MNESIQIKEILLYLYKYFQYIIQWDEHQTESFLELKVKYIHYAMSLLELAETFDCGSTGGFGKGQKYNTNPFVRFTWLYTKYVGDPKELQNFKQTHKRLSK